MHRAPTFAIHSADSSRSVNNMENADNEENNEDNIRQRSDCNNLAYNHGREWSAWNYDDSPIRYSKSNERRANRSCHSNCNIEIPDNCTHGKYDDGQFNGGHECEHNQGVDWNIWNCAGPAMNCAESVDRHMGRRYGWNCDKEADLLAAQNAAASPITGNMSHRGIKNCQNRSPARVNESVMDRRAIVRPTYSNESLNNRSFTWYNKYYQNPEMNNLSRRQQSRQPRMRQHHSFYPSDLAEFSLDYNNDLYDYTRSKNESLPRRKRRSDNTNDCSQRDETLIPNVRPSTTKWRQRSRNRDKRMPSGTRVGFHDRSRKCRRADKQRRKSRYRETTDCPPIMTLNDRYNDDEMYTAWSTKWDCEGNSDHDREMSEYRGKCPNHRWEADSHESDKCHSVCDCCSTSSLRSRKSGRSFESGGLRRKKSTEAICRRRRGRRREENVDGPSLIDSATGSKTLLASLNCESCKCHAVAGGDEVSSADVHVRNCTPSKASMFVETSGSVADCADSKRNISAHDLRMSEVSIRSKSDGGKVRQRHLDLAVSKSKSKIDPGKNVRIRGCSERCATRPIYIENPNQFYDSVSMENVDPELDYEWKRKVRMKDASSSTSITLKEKQKYRPKRIKSGEAIRVQSSETVVIRKRESRQMVQTASQTSQSRVPGSNQQSNPFDRPWWLELQAGRIWSRVHGACKDLINLAVTNIGQAMQEVPRPRRFARQTEFVDSANWPNSASSSAGNACRGESRWKSFARSKLPWNRKTLDRRDDAGRRPPAGVKRSCQTGTEYLSNFYGADASAAHQDRVPNLRPDAASNYDRLRAPNFADAECSHRRAAAKYYPSDGRSCPGPLEGSGQKEVYLQSSGGVPFNDLKHQKYPENRDRGGTDDNGDFPGQEAYVSDLFSYDFLTLDENSAPNSEVNGQQPISQEFQVPHTNETGQMLADNIHMNLDWMNGQVERVRGGSDMIDMWPTDVEEESDSSMCLERVRGGSDSNNTSPKQAKGTSETKDMSPEARKITLNSKPDPSKKPAPCWSLYENGAKSNGANDCKKIRDEMLEILCKESGGAYKGKLKCPPPKGKESNEYTDFYQNRSRGGSDAIGLSQVGQMDTSVCGDEYNTKIYERTQECRKRWMSLINYNSTGNGVTFSKWDESDSYDLFSKSDFEAMSKSRVQKQNLNPFSVNQPKWCLKRSIRNDRPFINSLENRNRGGSDRAKVAKRKERKPAYGAESNESNDSTTLPRYSANNDRVDNTICVNHTDNRRDMDSMTENVYRPMTCKTVEEQAVQTPRLSKDEGPKLSVSGTNERAKRSSDPSAVRAQKPEARGSLNTQIPMRKKADSSDVRSSMDREHFSAGEMNKFPNKTWDSSNVEDHHPKKLSINGTSPEGISVCVSGSKFREYQVSPSEENKIVWTKQKSEECPGLDPTPSKTDGTKPAKKKVDRPKAKTQNDTTKTQKTERNLKKDRSSFMNRYCPPKDTKSPPKTAGKAPAKSTASTFSTCVSKESKVKQNDHAAPSLPDKSSSTIPKSEDSRKIEPKKSKTRPPPKNKASKTDNVPSNQGQRKASVKKKLKPTKSKSSSSSSSSAITVQCEMKAVPVASKTPKVSPASQEEEPSAEPRNEQRSEPRNSRSESRGEPRTGSRSNSKSEPRSESRSGSRSNSRSEPRSGSRSNSRSEPRTESRSNSKSEPRTGSRSNSKSEPRTEPRSNSKSEPSTEPRSESKSEPRTSRDVDPLKAAYAALVAPTKQQKPKLSNVDKEAVSAVKNQTEPKRSSKTPAVPEVEPTKQTPNSPKAQIVREHDKGKTQVNVEIQTSNTILTQILSEFEFGDKKRRIVMSIKLETDPDYEDDDKNDKPDEKRDSAASKDVTGPRLSKDVTGPRLSKDATSSRLSKDVTGPRLSKDATSSRLSKDVTSPRLSKQSDSSPINSENSRKDSGSYYGSPGGDLESEADDQDKSGQGKEESGDETSQKEPNTQQDPESPLNDDSSSKADLNYDSDISESIKDSDVEAENENVARLNKMSKSQAAICANTATPNQYDQCTMHQYVQTVQEVEMVDAYTSTPQGAILKKHIRANSTCGGLCGRTMS